MLELGSLKAQKGAGIHLKEGKAEMAPDDSINGRGWSVTLVPEYLHFCSSTVAVQLSTTPYSKLFARNCLLKQVEAHSIATTSLI
jgi:hypothetical protein